MGKAGGIFPIALAVFVRSREINGVEVIILPDRCSDEAESKL